MNKIKFSIIVPVYNSSRYINKCIESVYNQKYKNWELILINDGSTDGSELILESWARKDKRIKVICQENCGPGLARNRGIKCASGDVLVFVDSDDFVDIDYLETASYYLDKHDVLFIDVERVDLNDKHLSYELMSNYKHYNKDSIIRSMMTGKIPWGGVRKIVRRDLVNKNGVLYSNLQVGEEAIFSLRIMLLCNSFSFLDCKPMYKYVERDNSQSKYDTEDPWLGTFNVVRNCLINYKIYDKYVDTLNALNATATLISIDRIAIKYSVQDAYIRIKDRINLYNNTRDKNAKIDIKSMMPKGVVLLPLINFSFIYPLILISKIRNIFRRCFNVKT